MAWITHLLPSLRTWSATVQRPLLLGPGNRTRWRASPYSSVVSGRYFFAACSGTAQVAVVDWISNTNVATDAAAGDIPYYSVIYNGKGYTTNNGGESIRSPSGTPQRSLLLDHPSRLGSNPDPQVDSKLYVNNSNGGSAALSSTQLQIPSRRP